MVRAVFVPHGSVDSPASASISQPGWFSILVGHWDASRELLLERRGGQTLHGLFSKLGDKSKIFQNFYLSTSTYFLPL